MLTLQIIVASTRPGRIGRSVADWMFEVARADPAFSTELVDLAEVNLPFFDEPKHPATRDYQHEHTKRWSATIGRADAFIVVTPEYNHFIPAPLVNALDFLVHEWAHKPLGLVSYGGMSGGLRAAQSLRPLAGALKLMMLNEAVVIPFVHQQKTEAGGFAPTEVQAKGAQAMLRELARVGTVARELRKG
jgi:NAD(P)H-dependent FMN reductase